MLHRGTAKHPTSHDLLMAASNFGAEIDAETGPDVTVIKLEFLPRYLVMALDLLAEIAIRPTFKDIDLEAWKEQNPL